MNFLKKNGTVILLLFFALMVRSVALNQSLWHDESGTVVAVTKTPLLPLITQYSIADFHPPGFFVILWGWVKIFGNSEISSRMPSVLFGVATVFITYLIGRKLLDKKKALLATLFLAIAPLHIYYSQEARMYSFAAFSVALSFYFFLKLINKEKYGVGGYVISLFLVFYSDYVAYFAIIPQFFYVILSKKGEIKRYLKALGLGLVTLLPWLAIFPKQLLNGLSTAQTLGGWKDVVGGANIKNAQLLLVKILIGRISFDSKVLYGVITAFFFIVFYGLVIKSLQGKKAYILFWWLIVPPVTGFIVSFFIPVFSYFRFLFILPSLYLLTAAGIVSFKSEKFKWLLTGIVVGAELFASFTYLLKPQFHREDWKNAVAYSDFIDNGNTKVLFKDVKVLSGYEYYSKKEDGFPAFFQIPAASPRDVLNNNITNTKKLIVFDYLTDITDPYKTLEKSLAAQGFHLASTKDFRGVGFVKTYFK